MTAAYVTIVGSMKAGDGEEQAVTISGMADVISFRPGSPPPRPHPGDPPGIWGGPIDPYPGHPLPEPPGKPPGIWGGGNQPFPTPPISLPGLPGWEPPKPGEEPPFERVVAWTPDTGWVVVYVPTGPSVAPSK